MRTFKMIKFTVLFIFAVFLTYSAQASLFSDTIDFLEKDIPVSFRILAEAEKLPQFDDNRTAQLNRLLRHLEITGTVDEKNTKVIFNLDNEELFSILECRDEGSKKSILTASGGISYHLSGKAEDAEINGFGQKAQADNPLLWNQNIFHALDNYHIVFSALPSAFPEHTNSGKISEKYRDYGTAVRKVTVVVHGEELNSYFLNQKESYKEFGLYPDPTRIIFDGRQSFTMYFSADNVLIRIIYTGHAGISADDIRNVRLDWKRIRSSILEKDEIELRTPNSKATKRDNFLLSHILKHDADGNETFTWSAETDRVSDGVRTREFSKASLNIQDNMISGTISECTSSRGKENITELLLNSSVEEEHSYNGTLEIIHKKDKIEMVKWLFRFDLSNLLPLQEASSVSDMISEENVSVQSIQEQLTTAVLRRMLMLPVEDLSFLKEGIPENFWEDILQIANN